MRAYAVYLTHAFVIKRELIPESGAKLHRFDFHFPLIIASAKDSGESSKGLCSRCCIGEMVQAQPAQLGVKEKELQSFG